MVDVLTEGWVAGVPGTFGLLDFGPFPEAIPVDPYILEPPLDADGSWQPLPVIRYPEADTYQGTATKATMTFSVPLPDQLGVLERWLGSKFRDGILSESRNKGISPLVVGVWRDTGPIFSTKYTLTMYAAGASPVNPLTIMLVVSVALTLLSVFGIRPVLKSFENILVGQGGSPAQLIPEGTPAPPGTVSPDGTPVTPGTPAPSGSYIPPRAGTPGLFQTVSGLAPLVLIGLLVSSFKKE